MEPPSPRRTAAVTLLSDPSTGNALPELASLGRSLREAREAQGLSLASLAARLNMGCEQLGALENGERERLPEAVFVIAQARRIASFLGVNVESQIEALRTNPAFSARPAQPAQPSQASRAAATPAPERNPSQRRLGPGPIAAALVAALGLAAGTVALQRLQKPAPQATPASAGNQPQASRVGQPGLATGPSLLALNARGPSWVEVASNDGTTLFRGLLEGRRSFPLGQGLRVLAGRPDLITAQIGDGPAQSLGTIDQVQWRRFAPGATAPSP